MTDQQAPNKSNGRGWGGPRPNSGRPPGPARHPSSLKKMRELAQSYTEEAIEALVDIMRTAEEPRDRLLAINILLDRGYGKPKEHVQIEQQDTLTKRYQTLEEIKAELIANGLPIDHLEAPKLIEDESKP
jgi:hypothetical protein